MSGAAAPETKGRRRQGEIREGSAARSDRRSGEKRKERSSGRRLGQGLAAYGRSAELPGLEAPC
jgi:hypothetical protein